MTQTSLFAPDARTRKRNAAEARFRTYGIIAISIGLFMLAYLLFTIVSSGWNGFFQTRMSMDITVTQSEFEDAESGLLKTKAYKKLIGKNFANTLADAGLDVGLEESQLVGIISDRAPNALRQYLIEHPEDVGKPISFDLLASSYVDGYLKGRVHRENIAKNKKISVEQLDAVDQLVDAGLMKKSFNLAFVTGNDASEASPEAAGFGPAITGSLAMMIVVLIGSVTIGVAASIFLEEFAPKNAFTDLIEVNISNLAAVPSIVFGILGLAVFVNYLGALSPSDWLKNNSAFVGGLVLTLMTLPTIIISTRASLRAVPPSIREAALGVGASNMQTVFHHVLPLAMPGILTGVIIGLAQALGESAPLLLIGLVLAQGAELPSSVGEFFGGPNTAMPAQIYQWSTRSDPAFFERAWGGIIILLMLLISMNAIAIILRRHFERRW